MIPFELAEPTTLQEALLLLDPDDASVRPLGGGTALMLMMKAGVFAPRRLVSLRKITALKRIAVADGGLVIGALTPLSDVEHSAEVAKRAAVIVRTMRRLSNVRVRNVATIGGNLAHGDPHMDLPPVLIALDAGIVVVGRGGERVLAVENLFLRKDWRCTSSERPSRGIWPRGPPRSARCSLRSPRSSRRSENRSLRSSRSRRSARGSPRSSRSGPRCKS